MKTISQFLWICIISYSMIQGYILAIIFPAFKKGDNQAKWLLSLISLCIALLLTDEVVSNVIGYDKLPHLIFAIDPFWYLLGPLFFFYLRLYLVSKRFTWKDLWHFIPFAFVVFNTMNFYGYSGDIKWNYYSSTRGYGHPVYNTNFMIFCIQTVFYVLRSRFYLELQKDRTIQQAKETKWVELLIIGLAVVAILSFISFFAMNFWSGWIWLNSAYFVIVSFFLLGLFLKSISPSKHLVLTNWSSGIDEERSSEHFESLLAYIENHKPYLNPLIDTGTISREIGYSRHFINSVIRSNTGKNFRDLMNEYRVKEAKEKLKSPRGRQFTIHSIALDSGFSSLATFYRVFKKVEGRTPKSFMQK